MSQPQDNIHMFPPRSTWAFQGAAISGNWADPDPRPEDLQKLQSVLPPTFERLISSPVMEDKPTESAEWPTLAALEIAPKAKRRLSAC